MLRFFVSFDSPFKAKYFLQKQYFKSNIKSNVRFYKSLR